MNSFISFFEIPATDFGRAVSFYEHLLECKLSVMEFETEKMAFFTDEDGECYGAISLAEEFNPSTDGPLLHFKVTNIDNAIEKITEKGGEILIPKTKIEAEGKGFFAAFKDCEGNRVGVHSLY